jgi:predicted AAA+ superfamily ATPase
MWNFNVISYYNYEMYKRIINLPEILNKKSLLLLGPRQVGKTTLLKESLPGATWIDLSDSAVFRELGANPEILRLKISHDTRVVVIDEAQRLPEIFNEVQLLLDNNKDLRIILTGSSARALKRKGVNLLPGRIWQKFLNPLIFKELGSARIIDRVNRGSLPGVIDSKFYKEELIQYVNLYLQEEIRAEGLVRGIGNFSRFLKIAALSNSKVINFTKIGNDCQVKPNTVRSFFEILKDTLIGDLIEPLRSKSSRKTVAASKFYLFDMGVCNALLDRFNIQSPSDIFGEALEQIIYSEIKAYNDYNDLHGTINHWRTQTKLEVDFIFNKEIAIEVKNSSFIKPKDLRALVALNEEHKMRRNIIVCNEPNYRKLENGIEIIPISNFLEELWGKGL